MSKNKKNDNFKPDVENENNKNFVTLNFGPAHPAMHGILQNIIKLDGEKIVDVDSTIGFVHRGIEKLAEHRSYNQFIPLADRLNYCSSPINTIGWQIAVEKMLGLEIPKRIQYLRVIIMELSRIIDHLICTSIMGVDVGGLTGFLYIYQERENVYDIFEKMTGGRMHPAIGRVGGFEHDIYPDFKKDVLKFTKNFHKLYNDFTGLFNRNRIFMDRTMNVGVISQEDAIDYGFTGPNLRATGVNYDVRKANPYCSYEEFDFEVPLGKNGDVYDRFTVRNEEMLQSIKIINQAIAKLPDEGPYKVEVPEISLPDKKDVYTKMESMIHHFKHVTEGIKPAPQEAYFPVEGGNGELGFYTVSDGEMNPYRLHLRRPCFIYYQALPKMILGGYIADAVATISSLNIIAGELDA